MESILGLFMPFSQVLTQLTNLFKTQCQPDINLCSAGDIACTVINHGGQISHDYSQQQECRANRWGALYPLGISLSSLRQTGRNIKQTSFVAVRVHIFLYSQQPNVKQEHGVHQTGDDGGILNDTYL